MRRIRAALALGLAGAILMGGPASAAQPTSSSNSDSSAARSGQTKAFALVQLRGAPLSTAASTKPAKGKKIDFSSASVKNYRAQLAAVRNEYKAWLSANAPKARLTKTFDVALNAVGVRLNGHTLAQIRGPQVLRAQYQGLYYPLDQNDPDLAIIDALDAWQQVGGPADAGDGVKVAIVDSGIDVTHPCFDDAGYPESNNPGIHEPFTNDKVIFAGVYQMNAKVRGYTPEAIESHGTHVAGTVACNLDTPATVNGVDIPYDISGVAPRALLGNFNVFPKDVANARSEDIVDALEDAYERGFDVANMSLGGGSRGIDDLLAMGTDNLDRANMVIAVAAGNSGPGHYTIESPGKAARALTAGGSTVGHFVGAQVIVGGATYGAAAGDFETVDADLTAKLVAVTTPASQVHPANGLSQACSALPAEAAAQVKDNIALISRGTCDFSTKIWWAQEAGAKAVLVVNHSAGDPVAMGFGFSPGGDQPTVPAYMVGLEDGKVLKTKSGQTTTITEEMAYFRNAANDDFQYSSSSQGPTDVDFRVKPDAVAPAVNVLSSISHNDPTCKTTDEDGNEVSLAPCFAFYQGTSMATPHLAGSAAVVIGELKEAGVAYTAAQVRSAITNTADRNVIKDYRWGQPIPGTDPVQTYGYVTDVQVQGAGQANLDKALDAVVALDPVSISFGAIPSGAGQTKSFAVRVTNTTGSAKTYTFSIADTTGTGAAFSASPSSLTLAAGASGTLTVRLTASKGASRGDHQAWLIVKLGTAEVAHAAVYTLVK